MELYKSMVLYSVFSVKSVRKKKINHENSHPQSHKAHPAIA